MSSDGKPADTRSNADMVHSSDTDLVRIGRDPAANNGFINPPVVRASTVLFENVEQMEERHSATAGAPDQGKKLASAQRYPYGLTNTPTIEALTDALTELEGPNAAGTVLVPSGLAAVNIAMLAMVKPGCRVLVPDNVYWPTRRFSDQCLSDLGGEVVYYDPTCAGQIADYFGSGHNVLHLEAPGSTTFEMPDLPAMVSSAKKAEVPTILDNTWATPLIFRALDHGIDAVVHAGTKYFAGHSDLLIGSISTNKEHWPRMKRFHGNMGMQAGTEEIWLTLRGLRTMSIRLERHERSTLDIARWMQDLPGVSTVLHPALPSCPGHDLWARDFGRSTGLFGFVLNGTVEQARVFLNALKLFGLGYSWGGFESLAVLGDVGKTRTVNPWTDGPVIRLHIGLEDVRDLKQDLSAAFSAAGL